jgi:arylsulfatase A-like enzyme
MPAREAIAVPQHPAYCGVRQKNWLYVQWSDNSGTELYDYAHDPLELHNLSGKAAYATKEAQLRADTMNLCSPVPPGFTW